MPNWQRHSILGMDGPVVHVDGRQRQVNGQVPQLNNEPRLLNGEPRRPHSRARQPNVHPPRPRGRPRLQSPLPYYASWPYRTLVPPEGALTRNNDKTTPEYIARSRAIVNGLQEAYQEAFVEYRFKKQEWLRCKEHLEEMEWNITYCKPNAGGDYVQGFRHIDVGPTQVMRLHHRRIQNDLYNYRAQMKEIKMNLATIERRIQTGLRSIARRTEQDTARQLRNAWAARNVGGAEREDVESYCSWSDSSGFQEREREPVVEQEDRRREGLDLRRDGAEDEPGLPEYGPEFWEGSTP